MQIPLICKGLFIAKWMSDFKMNTNNFRTWARRWLIVFGLLMWVSCGGEEVPEGILSEDEMVPILLEVYVAEGKVNELRVKRDSALVVFEEYETRILDKYALTDSLYTNSLRYYFEHPLKLESIYETVLDSLNLMEKRLDESKDGSTKEEGKDSVTTEVEKVVDT